MNPAIQLHELLSDIVALPPHATSWLGAWAVAIGTSEETVLDHMPAVISLYRETVKGVRVSGKNTSALLWAAPYWQRAVMMNDVRWTGAITESGFLLSEAQVHGLYAASLALDGPHLGRDWPDTSLELLKDKLADLRSIVDTEEDLPADLRLFLRQHIESMDQAIDEFTITGAWGVSSVVERVIATGITRPDLFERVTRSKAGKQFLALFAASSLFLAGYNDMAYKIETAISNTKQIVETVQNGQPKAIENKKPLELESIPSAQEGQSNADPPSLDSGNQHGEG
ncbi:MAG TPA: hypothetical protein VF557_20070 [Jatrophihabitans sp.]|jgi:hypothetical protein|uniref:hypothetical protein n=1 Tax=Jatrophihabitans sp. TaxID=1932789 RepID=UPI002F1794CE